MQSVIGFLMRSKIIRLPPMRHCIEKHNNILALKCLSKKYYRHRVRNRDRSEHYGIRLANKSQRKINEKQKKNYRRWTTIITSESSVYNLVHRPSTIEKCSLSHKLLAMCVCVKHVHFGRIFGTLMGQPSRLVCARRFTCTTLHHIHQ